MNTTQVINAFLTQSKSKAKNSTGSLYFEGPTIYSYGPHFKIAALKGLSQAIITTRRYSVTTTKHTNAVRHALVKANFALIEDNKL